MEIHSRRLIALLVVLFASCGGVCYDPDNPPFPDAGPDAGLVHERD